MNKHLKISIIILISFIIVAAIVFLENFLSKFAYQYFNKYIALVSTLHIPVLSFACVFYFFKIFYKSSLQDIDFTLKSFVSKMSLGIILGILILALCVFIFCVINGTNVVFAHANLASIIFTIITAIVVGFSEELYFRGFLNNVMILNNISFIKTTIISSILFAIVHLLSFNPANTSYFWFLGLFLFGILFSLLYKVCKSIFVPIGLHISWDIISFFLNGDYGFKGFYIVDFHQHIKQLDNIETLIIAIIVIVIVAKWNMLKNVLNSLEK
jgi:membrane protease YdiL (CAAX protease family)